MIHRVHGNTVSELNRVLELIQKGVATPTSTELRPSTPSGGSGGSVAASGGSQGPKGDKGDAGQDGGLDTNLVLTELDESEDTIVDESGEVIYDEHGWLVTDTHTNFELVFDAYGNILSASDSSGEGGGGYVYVTGPPGPPGLDGPAGADGAQGPPGADGDMTNPMTTAGDVIVGGVSGAPARLGIGTEDQVLTVKSGTPSWEDASGGLTNPMTTTGDIIVGGTSGTPDRLGIGSEGQVLTVSSGTPAWGAAPDTVSYSTVWISDAEIIGPLAADSAGNFTNAVSFIVFNSMNCTGVKFWGFSGRTYKCSLWNAAGTRIGTVTTSALGSTGIHSALFASPVALTVGATYRVSVWTGTNEVKTAIASRPFAPPFFQNPWVRIESNILFGSGDTNPTTNSSSGCHAVEPIMA